MNARFAVARRRSGMTIVELSVVVAIGVVVFGMILQAMTDTDRASREVVMHQTLRQEALTIGRGIEREIRYRVDSSDLETQAFLSGGAGQDSAAGGETTAPAVVAGPTPPAPAQPAPAIAPKPSADAFTAEALRFNSLRRKQPAGQHTVTLTTTQDATGVRHVTTVASETGLAPDADAAGDKLGDNPDIIQSEVSFRYAADYDGVSAKWVESVGTAPRLIEYTVRVWPKLDKYKTFVDAKADKGSAAAFEYTSAVVLP